MQVIRDLNTFTPPPTAIVTQGTFDGVHVGHCQILHNIVNLAAARNGKSVLVTFYPHPRHFLHHNQSNLKLLTDFDEKVALLSETGLDYLIVLPFDAQLSKMSAMNFIRDIMVEKIGVTAMVVGYDHRFGRNREGSFQDLKEFSELYGFEVIEIPAHDISEAIVSSTKIRHSLLNGDVEQANLFLGRPYTLEGTVIHGRKLGHTIGYPTANIKVNDSDKLVPANGVYAVSVKHNGKVYGGMLNIGDNPTIEGAKWSIEVNIFDFDAQIYGVTITIYFYARMRDELKFNGLPELIEQLKQDEIRAKALLNVYAVI
jgi:riboflavin kinase/FMN adenylyltransferase